MSNVPDPSPPPAQDVGGKPSRGLESQHTLSGHFVCAECGGRLIVNRATSYRNGRPVGRPQLRYVCTNHRHRPGSCSNKWGVHAGTITTDVLGKVRHHLALPAIVKHLQAVIAAPTARQAEREAIEKRITQLDTELRRAAETFFAADAPATIIQGIKDREGERRDLQAKLEHLQGVALADLPDFTSKQGQERWAREIKPILADLEADPVGARQALREIGLGALKVTPVGGRRGGDVVQL